MAVRITQIPVETSIAPQDARIRVTQVAVETSIAPQDGRIRVTQIAVETSVAITQVYQLTSWESDEQHHVISPFKNLGFVFEDSLVIPLVTSAVQRQPRITIMT